MRRCQILYSDQSIKNIQDNLKITNFVNTHIYNTADSPAPWISFTNTIKHSVTNNMYSISDLLKIINRNYKSFKYYMRVIQRKTFTLIQGQDARNSHPTMVMLAGRPHVLIKRWGFFFGTCNYIIQKRLLIGTKKQNKT